jgi:hypothetical protein
VEEGDEKSNENELMTRNDNFNVWRTEREIHVSNIFLILNDVIQSIYKKGPVERHAILGVNRPPKPITALQNDSFAETAGDALSRNKPIR